MTSQASHDWSTWRVRADGTWYRFCWACRLVEDRIGETVMLTRDDQRVKGEDAARCGGATR